MLYKKQLLQYHKNLNQIENEFGLEKAFKLQESELSSYIEM